MAALLTCSPDGSGSPEYGCGFTFFTEPFFKGSLRVVYIGETPLMGEGGAPSWVWGVALVGVGGSSATPLVGVGGMT